MSKLLKSRRRASKRNPNLSDDYDSDSSSSHSDGLSSSSASPSDDGSDIDDNNVVRKQHAANNLNESPPHRQQDSWGDSYPARKRTNTHPKRSSKYKTEQTNSPSRHPPRPKSTQSISHTTASNSSNEQHSTENPQRHKSEGVSKSQPRVRIDPSFIPKLGNFWLQDDRSGSSAGVSRRERPVEAKHENKDEEKSDLPKDEICEKREIRNETNGIKVNTVERNAPPNIDNFLNRGDSKLGKGALSRNSGVNRLSYTGPRPRGGIPGNYGGTFSDFRRRDIWSENDESGPINSKWTHDKFEELQKDHFSDRRRSWAPQPQQASHRGSYRKEQYLEKKTSTPNFKTSSPEFSERENHRPHNPRQNSYSPHPRPESPLQNTQRDEWTYENEKLSKSEGRSSPIGNSTKVGSNKTSGVQLPRRPNTPQSQHRNIEREVINEESRDKEVVRHSSAESFGDSTTTLRTTKRYFGSKLPPPPEPPQEEAKASFMKKVIHAPEFKPTELVYNASSLTSFQHTYPASTTTALLPNSTQYVYMPENGMMMSVDGFNYAYAPMYQYPMYFQDGYYQTYDDILQYQLELQNQMHRLNLGYDDRRSPSPYHNYNPYVKEEQMDDELWVTDGVPDLETLKEFEINYDQIEEDFRRKGGRSTEVAGDEWESEVDSESDESEVEIIIDMEAPAIPADADNAA